MAQSIPSPLQAAPALLFAVPTSRWSDERSAAWEPVRNTLVAEVQYDHVTGDRFRHGTRFIRWRPDKAPKQCTTAQLKEEGRPSRIMAAVVTRTSRRPRNQRKADPEGSA